MTPLRLELQTPTEHTRWDDVVSLRLHGTDGHRGIQPGHEPAVIALVPGVVHLGRLIDERRREQVVALDGGLAWIEPREVVLVSRWISPCSIHLDVVLERLRSRAATRARREQEARTLLARHETATRRAMIDLQREVSW